MAANMDAFNTHKMGLITALTAVAQEMRNCAVIADGFAQMIAHVGGPVPPMGQFPMSAGPAPAFQDGRKRKARGEEDGTGRKRKPKKPKDPNAPKRPASSYLLFQNEIRAELKAKHPDLQNNALLTMISKMWQDMPKEDKEKYEVRQKAEKSKYLSDKADYEKEKGESPVAVPGQVPAVPIVQQPVAPTLAPAPVESTSDSSSSDDDGDDEEEDESGSEENTDENEEPPPKKKKQEIATPQSKDKKPKNIKA